MKLDKKFKIFLIVLSSILGIFVVLFVLIGLVMSSGILSDPITGAMVESNFALSDNSRLPKWFNVPNGYERKDLTVQISYYASPKGKPDLKAELIDKKGRSPREIVMFWGGRALETKYGSTKNISNSIDGYPHFVEGTVDGISDIIEHRAMEPIFYISDSSN